MAEKTIFQRICDHEIPADIVHEDDVCVCFRDINPLAPVHLLLVPRKPIARLAAATPEDAAILGHLMAAISEIAAKEGFAEDGFRLIANSGPHAGEEVPHLHFHILAGKPLGPMLGK
jgi:histidine triad (HIT) family protein